MAAIAEFRLNADAFPLGAVFTKLPDATVVLERVVPTETHLVPYVWVHDASIEDIETVFEDHAGIERVEVVDSLDGDYLLRVEWDPENEGVLTAITSTGVTLLSGEGNMEVWRFEIRGADRSDIAAFQAYCREHGIPIELTGLHGLMSVETDSPYELTDTQLEALLLAHERGYYETPRRATLEEIAEELDISRQALSSRIRRGTDRLIDSTLAGPGRNT